VAPRLVSVTTSRVIAAYSSTFLDDAVAPDAQDQCGPVSDVVMRPRVAGIPARCETIETMRHSCYCKGMIGMITVEEAGRALGVSRSTVWRLIQRGDLPSIRRGGRRLIPATAVQTRTRRQRTAGIPPFSHDHPMFRLIGAGRGGGRTPGARDKHAIVDR
jgi:excisionase family DNA binding protein